MVKNLLLEQDFNFNPGTLGIPSIEVKSKDLDYMQLKILSSPINQYQDSRLESIKIKKIACKIWPTKLNLTVVHSATTFATLLSYALALKSNEKLTILTSLHEHAGGIRPFENLSKFYDVCYLSDEELNSRELFADAIQKHQPGICFLSHLMHDTGWILPISEYGEIIKKFLPESLFIVDVAQSLGLIELPKTMFVDAMFGSAHKWLMGPHGTGLLWTSKYFRDQIDAIYLSEKGEEIGVDSGFSISGGQDFSIYPQILASIELYRENGVKRVQETVSNFSNLFWSYVKPIFDNNAIKVQRVDDLSELACAPFLVVCFEKYDPYPLYQRMNQSGLYVKCIKDCLIFNKKYHLLRIGIPFFESEERVRIAALILENCLNDAVIGEANV